MTANEPRIIIYGQGDRSELGFPTPDDLKYYIEEGVASKEQRRFRYTQRKNADIIILSLDGFAYGHFHILSKENPNKQDKEEYPPAKCAYIVGKRAIYAKRVHLNDLGIRVGNFGCAISLAQFEQIKRQAGDIRELD